MIFDLKELTDYFILIMETLRFITANITNQILHAGRIIILRLLSPITIHLHVGRTNQSDWLHRSVDVRQQNVGRHHGRRCRTR